MQHTLIYRFGRGTQEDAEEFLSFLLNEVSESFNSLSGAVNPIPGSADPNPSLCMRGSYSQSNQCTVCSNLSNCYVTPFFLLRVPLPGDGFRAKLGDLLLHDLTTEELLIGDNRFDCNSRHNMVTGRRHTVIQSPPAILELHLQRFSFSHDHENTKRMTQIAIEPTITLYCSDLRAVSYYPYSIVMHDGPRSDHGHYFSICGCRVCSL